MAEYLLSFKERKEIAEGTMSFYFEKPEGFDFKAGQYLDWTLIDPPHTDDEGNMRTFSVASSPHEPDIMLTSRMRPTAFKNSLKEIPAGTKVRAEGPFGSFTLHKNDAKPAVFLAGGIGITPFRSMIGWATHQKSAHKINLFYSNRTLALATFLDELKNWQRENDNFKLIATLTDEKPSGWPYETGKINGDMIKKHVSDLKNSIFYVAGPPGMVKAMIDMLLEIKIDEDNIKSEDFAGY